ncbi:hypothetical protein LguiB_000071 [Lonicera macranthoides]
MKLSSSIALRPVCFFIVLVAPSLFQALLAIPHMSQITYIGMDGIFFSYYKKNDQQPFAMYSNSLISLNTTKMYTWYTQPVNQFSGKLQGAAIKSRPKFIPSTDWFRKALNSTNGNASLGTMWTDDKYLLILNRASIKGRGVIYLGFETTSLINFFSDVDRINGSTFYLATKEGKVLCELGIPNTHVVLVGDSVSFQLPNPNGDQMIIIGNVTCQQNDGTTLQPSILNILGQNYIFYCTTLQIVGVQSVYVLALPNKGPETFIHANINFAFLLLLVLIGVVVFAILVFAFLIVRAATREMHLCATLIKQMEATSHAERKGMNKSIAFASASHDVRASLAGIEGLIEICHHEVAHGSELESNLVHMETCTKDLLALLNSILDTSKIEAGKMQLEIEEFDMAQLLESEVDLFYSVGMKKGVDVILDLYDGSITKFSRVKGDHGKLKQILSNLLSNAVKFTSEGHVFVRAWAKKPSLENSIISSTQNHLLRCLSCFLFKNDGVYNDIESTHAIQKDPNYMEFVFEVNDTGKGIPKEKHKSIFEDYVQVKETALKQEGTGLGLGIVQSLVRLMGGEIMIVEKELGEKGTCFRFSVFLITCNDKIEINGYNVVREDDIESSYMSSDSYQHSWPSIRLPSPKVEGSHVVLFIQNEERRKISCRFMERQGLKVSVVMNLEQLSTTLKKIKSRYTFMRYSSSGRSDTVSRSNSSPRLKEVPLSSLDGTDEMPLPLQRRANLRGVPNFTLIVIDTSGGPFRELSRAVADFRKDLCLDYNRVVWINKPGVHSIHVQGLDKHKLPPSDLIITKPFHGSRLNQVIELLPEFANVMPQKTCPNRNFPSESTASTPQAQTSSNLRNSPSQKEKTKNGEIQEIGEPCNGSEMYLKGKKILVAEDNQVLCKVAVALFKRLGAIVVKCGNGEEALELVRNGLMDQRRHRASHTLPYDYIFMDCEMPVMDGYEATRRIRNEEEYYGVHIPIIALTAHTAGEETQMIIQAGMDVHLPKPLRRETLLEALAYIQKRVVQASRHEMVPCLYISYSECNGRNGNNIVVYEDAVKKQLKEFISTLRGCEIMIRACYSMGVILENVDSRLLQQFINFCTGRIIPQLEKGLVVYTKYNSACKVIVQIENDLEKHLKEQLAILENKSKSTYDYIESNVISIAPSQLAPTIVLASLENFEIFENNRNGNLQDNLCSIEPPCDSIYKERVNLPFELEFRKELSRFLDME